VLVRHHKKPKSRGGGDENQNILWLPKNFHETFHQIFGDLTPQEQHLFLQIINNLSRLSWVDIKVLRNTIKTRKKAFQESIPVNAINISIGDKAVNFTMLKEEKINGRLVRYFTMSSSDLENLKHFKNVIDTFIKMQQGEVLLYIS